MSRIAVVIVAMAVTVPAMYPVAHACGDKFLMAGRGAKFQRAYASVYPSKLLIYARRSTDPKAAIRDPQLQKALRQAGHSVSIIDDWGLLEQALKTVPIDIVLVDVSEAAKLRPVIADSLAHPEPMYIAFPSSRSAVVQRDLICRLKSSDGSLKYLEEIENVLKARSRVRWPAATGTY